MIRFFIDTLRVFLASFSVKPTLSPVWPQQQKKSSSADLVRADDLLVLQLDFYNLRVETIGTTKSLVSDGPRDSFIIAHFPGQHIAEQAVPENQSAASPPPVSARLAGESRLVFHVPANRLPLAYTPESILAALSECAPLVADRVTVPPLTPEVGEYASFGGLRSQFCAIEAPWRLILSPGSRGRWAHSAQPVKVETRAELWHTRLGVKPSSGIGIDESPAASRTARAVYSPDYTGFAPSPNEDDTPFLSSLNRHQRYAIVRSTADRQLLGNRPVAVERLMLSSLGAWLQIHGMWDNTLNLIEWRHRATLGRDQLVRVVEKGYLFPLGHRAVKVTVTERKIAPGLSAVVHHGIMAANEATPVAYLRQRTFVIVREPVKRYGHRHMPFRSIAIKTGITPPLIVTSDEAIGEWTEKPFWPRYMENGVTTDVIFQAEGTDWAGQVTAFGIPQIFVPFDVDAGQGIDQLVDAYNDDKDAVLPRVPEAPRRTSAIGGRKIAFAPTQTAGDTTLETETFIFGALNATGMPHFLPAMRGASVTVPAVRQIAKDPAPYLIRFDDGYLNAQISPFGNKGEVYARIENPPDDVTFPIEKSGGLVAPNFKPGGISRAFGPVGAADSFAEGRFQPGNIFAGIKILGGIPLDKIFKMVPFGWPAQAGERVPSLRTVRAGNVLRTCYTWNATSNELQEQPIFKPLSNARFELRTLIETPLNGTAPKFSVTGALEHFKVVLPGASPLIAAQFKGINFSAGSDKKVDVSVEFDEIVFEGVLSFVNDIRKYIPLDGFADPPSLDVDATGVRSGYSLAIPSIAVGMFSLQDVKLGAGFHLPFVGGAAGLRFAFCERDHPFLLTVSLFGGGGFFALDLDTVQVTSVEASLEFGAAVAINLGVASGRVAITGGVYYQKSGEGFQIVAFYRAAGALDVLGLICISVELYIGLGFQSNKTLQHGGKLYGTASVKVKIKIAFFSKSVRISIDREFAGSDPTFSQMLDQDDWAEYYGAFALEAA